jgi:arginase
MLSRDSLRVQTANWAQGGGYRHRHAKYIDKLHRVLGDTRDLVADALRAGQFPIVLGGGHSTAAGTIAGIKTAFPHRRLGVVWIDAHADIHSPHTTPSGNMHGMPVAIATATDNLAERINDVDADTLDLWARCKALGVFHGANVSLDDLVYVAVRDTEKAEDHLIETHAIMNLTTDTVRALGAEAVARRCLDRLQGVDLIYVTFDVDSMDATICMGTGTPSPHGIFLEEARLLNEMLVRDPRVCCWAPPRYVSLMSGEPSNFNTRAMARWLAKRGRPRAERQLPGPRPTLTELQRSHCWTWVYCEKCLHHAPMALGC